MIRYTGEPYEGSDDQANDMIRAEQRKQMSPSVLVQQLDDAKKTYLLETIIKELDGINWTDLTDTEKNIVTLFMNHSILVLDAKQHIQLRKE